jgi:NTE family protein
MTLAFVFGAGSSRGALQAGALEILFEAGIRPDMTVGSSIGALNAAWVADTPTLEGVQALSNLYRRTRFVDIFEGGVTQAFLNFVRGHRSLFDNAGMATILASRFGGRRLGELALPCYIVATDLDSAELHVWGDDPDDPIVPAVTSSGAIIPLQPPYAYRGRLYGDGGLHSALPLGAAADRGATAVLGFNVLTQLQTAEQRHTPFDLLLHSVDLLLRSQVQLTIATMSLPGRPPCHVLDLTPARYVSITDMDQLDSMISEGREQTAAALPAIWRLLDGG